MASRRRPIYKRGEFWLDHERRPDGRPVSPNLYIFWYEAGPRKTRRKSTGTSDIQLACDALDAHYLAAHEPTDPERKTYTVLEAMTDYYLEHGQKQASAESIRARLKLLRRFIDHEIDAGRLKEPLLPAAVDDKLLNRFRAWGLADPIVARKKDGDGNWVAGSTRKRAASTVEESVIQLKAALKFAENSDRINEAPALKHKTRDKVTPERKFRLSTDGLAEILDFTMRGSGNYEGHAARLLPLRRYMIGAITTLGRPDAILDMSVAPERGQWMNVERRFDLNPVGRLQTKKRRPVMPVVDLLHSWLLATDDRLVCYERIRELEGVEVVEQVAVASVRSAWDTMRQQLKLPAGWGPKLIRHSMATILANRGVDLVELEIVLGHRVINKTTERYVIFSPDYLKTIRAGIDDVAADLARKVASALTPPVAR
ncbi:MAG: hypothetical protein ACK4SZ_02995 [Allosphingosinicella sp.]|uniref:hypothetical protein n=1 Tax=Allosphingosinicella sp. TaxID=2823234 RepID=UPI0039283E5B